MKMKRNTKSNPKSSNKGADIVIVILCLLITLISFFLFAKNLNRTFSRTDKVPVATVSFKYKSVQRRFLDRAVWDRPKQNSPVYNGDTIRTSPDAEATLYFTDRNIVELGSNTMIQVFVNSEESRIDIDSGLVSVETAEASDMLISSGNATAKVAKASALRADKGGADDIKFIVERGEASVTEQNNAEQEELLIQGSVMQTGSKVPLVMISPKKNVKFLNQSGYGVDIPFKWQNELPAGETLILETSSTSIFSNTKTYTVTDLSEFTATKETKPFYWRLYAAKTGPNDLTALSGKVNIVSAPAPTLLEPAIDAKYTYTSVLPAIRFLWEGNDLAASYLLEVADNPELHNPQFSRFTNTQSLTLSEFGEGTWYWRVTPRYLIGADNAAALSQVSFFHVDRQAVVSETPKALMPQTTTETANGKSITFAWKNISETKSYRLKVAKDAQMKTLVVDEFVEANYFKLENAAEKLPNDSYYWTVSAVDSKGAELTTTKPIQFQTINSDLMLRSIFPPDGYVIADTLCPDTRFTWKTNIEAEKHFQVSSSKDFSSFIVNIKVLGNGIDGLSLPQGEWYWRLVSDGEDGTVKTETKRFTIVPPLDKSTLFQVTDLIAVFPEKKNTFSWSPVAGADYYQVRIVQGTGSEEVSLYENLFFTNTQIDIPLHHAKEGNYRITLQGFAFPSVMSTRRYGLTVDQSFTLKHLRPVELLYPLNKASISGLEAALNPFSFKWSTTAAPNASKLILRKSGIKKPVLEVSNPSVTVKAPPLEAGKYTWEVKASVLEGFDISSKKEFSFSVSPIPLLPPVAFEEPKERAVLDAAFFKSNRSIDFRWAKVPEATHYLFTLSDSSGHALFKTEIPANSAQPAFNFKDITRLSRGSFSIEIKAQRRLRNGKVFQDGTLSRLHFSIDLPKSKTIRTNETGVLYGK